MARMPRLVIPGQLHHLLQRGHNRQAIVEDAEDGAVFLGALREASQLHDVKVHAYVLMPTHLHLLVTPGRADSLARAMQTLGRRYVAYFNRRYARSGTLWEGRFRTMLAEADAYFEPLLVYVEHHPVRAGLVERAADYPWSSAAHHLGLRRDPLVVEHPAYWRMGNTPFERELRLRQAFEAPLDAALLALLRERVHSGWPLLSAAGAAALQGQVDRPLSPRPPGRPRAHSVPN